MGRLFRASSAWFVGAGVLLGCSSRSAPTATVAGDASIGAAVELDASTTVGAPLVVHPRPRCPDEAMALVGAFCIDRWEAYVVELDAEGNERPHSPYEVVGGLTIRAKSAPNVVPQAYISQIEASEACDNAGKRLCAGDEFRLACEGPNADHWYPYGGEARVPGDCNEGKGSMVPIYYGANSSQWTYADFNDPRLNQIDGGLAPTGSYPRCKSPWGIFDCVGNLHEWGSDPADANGHGRFRGGFYGDAEVNGHGCRYVTSAHELSYHDYSTGFRCCADPQ